MFFSVCVAVYNANKYLEESVDSILHQSFQDYEIILVDDASTDGSGILCDEIARKNSDRVKVIHHEVNRGLLLARRTFFEKASGEWFVAVDADDKLLEGALGKIYNSIEKNDCDLVLYDLDCFHMDGHIEKFTVPLKEGYIYKGSEKKAVYEQINKGNYINSICTKAIHRSLIDYDTDYSQWEKLRFGTDIFQSYPIFDNAKRIIYIKEALYAYIKRSEAITTKWHPDWYVIRRILWRRNQEYQRKWNLDDANIQLAAAGYIRGTVYYLDSQFLLTPSYEKIKEWYNALYYDGDIAECLRVTMNIKKRHSAYAKAISKHRFVKLFIMQKTFAIAKRILIKE